MEPGSAESIQTRSLEETAGCWRWDGRLGAESMDAAIETALGRFGGATASNSKSLETATLAMGCRN